VDVKELAALVRAMRNVQKSYFRSKSPAALEAAKAAELRVDTAVADVLGGQKGLFESEEKS
jgi:hypothetical protein